MVRVAARSIGTTIDCYKLNNTFSELVTINPSMHEILPPSSPDKTTTSMQRQVPPKIHSQGIQYGYYQRTLRITEQEAKCATLGAVTAIFEPVVMATLVERTCIISSTAETPDFYIVINLLNITNCLQTVFTLISKKEMFVHPFRIGGHGEGGSETTPE